MITDTLLYQNPERASDRFLIAFLSLLKVEKYKNITITQLCAEANLSRKTFYENFKTKEDLLDYFINASCISYPKSKNNQGPFLHYFKYWYNLQEWVLVFLQNDIWHKVNIMILKRYIPLLSNHNWEKMLGEQYQHQELIFHFFSAGFSEIIHQWALRDFKESPEELAEMVETILSGRFAAK